MQIYKVECELCQKCGKPESFVGDIFAHLHKTTLEQAAEKICLCSGE